MPVASYTRKAKVKAKQSTAKQSKAQQTPS